MDVAAPDAALVFIRCMPHHFDFNIKSIHAMSSSPPWLGGPINKAMPSQDSISLFAFTVLLVIDFQIQIHQPEPSILGFFCLII